MMNKYKRIGLLTSILTGALVSASPLHAADIPWQGTANYGSETVGPFDTYDFAPNGVVLLQGALKPGATEITGYYQSYVIAHTLDGIGVSAPGMNTTGTGDGYELTITATFTQDLSGPGTDIKDGMFSIYLDATPDYNYAADSGFSGDNASEKPIIQGTIESGSGFFDIISGIGVTGVNLSIAEDGADETVFGADGMIGGSSIFTLKRHSDANPTVPPGANSVMGNAYNPAEDILTAADGNLTLQAVPIPAAVWLFGSALIGFVSFSRRQKV